MNFYDQLVASDIPVMMGTVEQGEVMFVPSGYVDQAAACLFVATFSAVPPHSGPIECRSAP